MQQCHPWISSNARCSITSRTRGRPHGNTSLLEMFSSSLSKTNHKQYFLKQFLSNLKNNQTINSKLVFIKVHFVSFWKISISLTNMDNAFRIEWILLLLRSFWAVTWLVCKNFEFGAKIGQKWPKKALNDQKRPKSLKMTSETISIGFLLLLRSFWVVTWLLCNNFKFEAKIDQNGQKRPKKAKNDQKWPKCL